MLVLVVAGCHRGDRQRAFDIPGDRGSTIQVEVLNASGRDGLARTGTRLLREAGIEPAAIYTPPGSTLFQSVRIALKRSDHTRAKEAIQCLAKHPGFKHVVVTDDALDPSMRLNITKLGIRLLLA